MQITRGYDSSGTSRRTETTEVRKVGICRVAIPFHARRATHLNVKNGVQHVINSRRRAAQVHHLERLLRLNVFSRRRASAGHTCVITRVIVKQQWH